MCDRKQKRRAGKRGRLLLTFCDGFTMLLRRCPGRKRANPVVRVPRPRDGSARPCDNDHASCLASDGVIVPQALHLLLAVLTRLAMLCESFPLGIAVEG
jgi:hypothetical protein